MKETSKQLHSPSRKCPAACGGEEAKGDRAEALAKAGVMLRRSSAWLRHRCAAPCRSELHFICRIIIISLLPVLFVLGPFGLVVWGEGVIKIGVVEEPKTLNIWLASDSWSRKVLSQIYHPLYIREPKNLKLIPWLAEEEPIYDEATLSYTIKLRKAKWSDGSEFTSEDVAFTGDVIKAFGVPRYYSSWKFVKKI